MILKIERTFSVFNSVTFFLYFILFLLFECKYRSKLFVRNLTRLACKRAKATRTSSPATR